ncbi:hypothetical protein BN946_scf184977.g96 [Trametes cinnabarina]|uniref:Uncharacterized protein n=1 Tax=Pycnoporus cinnabarinus TaxID=5643 RepID=A0A060SD30_PYCCI|nr:hypothetical protein BN946_scf184977.g96 [Trametes cinnabarina]
MRTPSLACALFAAAALSPALVSGAPFPTPGSYSSEVFAVSKAGSNAPADDSAAPIEHTRPRIGIKEIREALPDHQPQGWFDRNEASRSAFFKRTTDDGTLGGNAYTGNSGDVNGGDVVNEGDNFGMPTLMNMNSNNAGAGGGSLSGCAGGGYGGSRGAGGNAYSGSSGNAEGGEVFNSGGVMNVDSNNAGSAGTSQTGCATGGDVPDQPDFGA